MSKVSSATVARDQFGYRTTSKCAKMNSLIIKAGPIEPTTIAKRTKFVQGFVYNHLRALVAKNLVRKTDEGFVVRKGKRSK